MSINFIPIILIIFSSPMLTWLKYLLISQVIFISILFSYTTVELCVVSLFLCIPRLRCSLFSCWSFLSVIWGLTRAILTRLIIFLAGLVLSTLIVAFNGLGWILMRSFGHIVGWSVKCFVCSSMILMFEGHFLWVWNLEFILVTQLVLRFFVCRI